MAEAPPVNSGITATPVNETDATINFTATDGTENRVEFGDTASYGTQVVIDEDVSNVAPTNSDIVADQITETEATVSWRSNVGGETIIEYGDTTAYGAQVVVDSAPLISNVTIITNSISSVTIEWDTSEPATGQIEYGQTIAYGLFTTKDSALALHHSQVINGLSLALYHFRVISGDPSNNVTYGNDITFSTDTVAPVISNVTASAISANSVTISWDLSELATGQVEYGETTGYGQLSVKEASFNYQSHSQVISGLTPGVPYHYRVISADETGNQSVSQDYSFTTSTDNVINWIAAGPFVSGTGPISVTFPAGYTANDLAVLLVESANESVATPYGWTLHANGMIGQGTAGAAGSVRLTAFYKLCASVESAVTLADSGDHTLAVIHLFRGAINTANPIEQIVKSTTIDTAPDKVFHPGDITTSGTNRLIIYAMATANAVNYANNVTWDAALTERSDNIYGVVPSLSSSHIALARDLNLSVIGSEDWAHWGLTDQNSFNHKSGVNKISDISLVGGGVKLRYTDHPYGCTWTDGTPTASASNVKTGVYVQGINKGFSLTVPADTTKRILTLNTSLFHSNMRVVSHLSDNSSPDLTDDTISDLVDFTLLEYAIEYRAASAGQTLTVTVTSITGSGADCNVTLESATLAPVADASSGGGISVATLNVSSAGVVTDKTGYEQTRNNVALLGIVLQPVGLTLIAGDTGSESTLSSSTPSVSVQMQGVAGSASTSSAALDTDVQASGASRSESMLKCAGVDVIDPSQLSGSSVSDSVLKGTFIVAVDIRQVTVNTTNYVVLNVSDVRSTAAKDFFKEVRLFAERTKPWQTAIFYFTKPDENWDLTLVSERVYGRRDEYMTIMAAAGLDMVDQELTQRQLVLPTDEQLYAIKRRCGFESIAAYREDFKPVWAD
jgi:hypothetical protein